MACVYGLRAKGEDQYFYIGSTKHAPKHRLQQHLDMIRLGRNKNLHLVRKVNKIGAENVCIDVLEECDDLVRFEREYEIIQHLLAQGVKLTNILHNLPQFEITRQVEEYENYELFPNHFEAMVAAIEGKTERNGDSLHDKFCDLVDNLSWHLALKHLDGWKEMIAECMAKHYEPNEANRQADRLYQRISEVLERDGSSAESRLLG